MSEWNQEYCDEIGDIDNLFQKLFIDWRSIDIDFEKERPSSLDDFKESIEQLLEAYSYFANEIRYINGEE